MQDMQESGYLSDDEEFKDKYLRNLDHFLKSRGEQLAEPLRSHASILTDKNEKRLSTSGSFRTRKRSLSISALGKQGSIISDPIISGTPRR